MGKRVFSIIFFIILINLLIFSIPAIADLTEIKGMNEIYSPFTVYYPHDFEFDQFLHGTKDSNIINKWANGEIIPKIDENTGTISGAQTDSGVEVKNFNMEILCDKEKMNNFMQNFNIGDILQTKIISMSSFIDGYILYIETSDGIFYTVLLNGYDEYGGFTNHKLYTRDQFIKLCEPKDCTLYIFDNRVVCDQNPIMQYGYTLIPLRALLENIGFKVEWQDNTKSVIFTKDADSYQYVTNIGENPYGIITKNGKTNFTGGFCKIVNGRILVDDMFISSLNLGLFVNQDANLHKITIGN